MMHISRSARALTCILATLLLVPTLGISIQSKAALERFHNRRLSTWPTIDDFRAYPVRYFQGVRDWFADRVFPIRQVSQIKKRLIFFALDGAPEPRITLGKD